MFRLFLPLAALRDPEFTPQMQLDALEQAYCRAFSLLDECELPTPVDLELRRRFDVLLAHALGMNVSMMPGDQLEITDIDDHWGDRRHERYENDGPTVSSNGMNDTE